MSIIFGCHGSTWELDYDKASDRLDHILDVISQNGFNGIDAQIALLGRYRNEPQKLADALASRGLELAAFTLPFSWLAAKESIEEKALSDYFIDYLKYFPKAILNIAARVGPDRHNLLIRQKQIVSCVNALAQRAADHGVVCSFHPNSPLTSYFRTEEDYATLFDLLDARYVGWTPDAGHILYGGMDVLKMVKQYSHFIKHFHIKDAQATPSPTWCKMGSGDIPFPDIVHFLATEKYQGWIMVEEETLQSSQDPDKAIHDISQYVEHKLKPFSA